MRLRFFTYLFTVCCLTACGSGGCSGRKAADKENGTGETKNPASAAPAPPSPSPTALKLDSMGLVDIAGKIGDIAVKLVYATSDNFTGEVLYDGLNEAYLLPEAAGKLSAAQKLLRERRPGYSLIVYDAARPMSVQRKMRETAARKGKQYYVADPAKGGGLHNYGAAVDVSVLDDKGLPLPMGTPYDFLGPESNTDKEHELVSSGKITPQELENRLLLREVMRSAGWRTVTSEWWHFNYCSREEAKRRYALIDF